MRRQLYAFSIVVVLLVLGGAWFITMYEQVTTQVRVGPSAAARANPFLAAMRFAERLGLRASALPAAQAIEQVAPGGTLLLPDDRSGLSAPRIRALENWIKRGGHAIVEPEPVGTVDPLLDRFGIRRAHPEWGATAVTMEARLPGAAEVVQLGSLVSPALEPGGHRPDVVLNSPDGRAWMLSQPIGTGRLTVIGGMRRFENRSIGAHDHAELLRRTLALTPAAELVVVQVPRALPLWDWLVDNAVPTLASGAILLLTWLALVLPRFGPIQPDPTPQRRQLREHILATGRFRWLRGGRGGLLAATREVAHRHVAALHPRIAHLPPQRRWRELSGLTGVDPQSLARAFEDDARSAREFVHIVATLASIHASLLGRDHARTSWHRSR